MVVESPCGFVVERSDNDTSHHKTQIWLTHFISSVLKHKSCPFHLLGMSYKLAILCLFYVNVVEVMQYDELSLLGTYIYPDTPFPLPYDLDYPKFDQHNGICMLPTFLSQSSSLLPCPY